MGNLMNRSLPLLAALGGLLGACAPATTTGAGNGESSMHESSPPAATTEVATFGAGCFWCVEAVLEQLEGVAEVSSGYMGGDTQSPTYEDVCSGRSGHAEVVQVRFDPAAISFGDLLEWFWRLHDPTTADRQGADIGPQYRSAIFYHSEAQRAAAEASRAAADAGGDLAGPIVTEITAAGRFHPAEPYHQDYYRRNRQQSYCTAVIRPKLDKLGLQE